MKQLKYEEKSTEHWNIHILFNIGNGVLKDQKKSEDAHSNSRRAQHTKAQNKRSFYCSKQSKNKIHLKQLKYEEKATAPKTRYTSKMVKDVAKTTWDNGEYE